MTSNHHAADLILASASRVRAKMLANAGVPFRVIIADIDEQALKDENSAQGVSEVAGLLAEAKALKISQDHPDNLVIGADQILECDGQLFDKPVGHAGAIAHLTALRGQQHRLITSACVVKNGETVWRETDNARLTMRNFSDEFLAEYLEKAGEEVQASVGAYRLEDIGAQLFTGVEGDFFTVLGLPLLPLLEFLRGQRILTP